MLTRLDRQISTPPKATPTNPTPAPPPSWLRSNSTDVAAIDDDIITGSGLTRSPAHHSSGVVDRLVSQRRGSHENETIMNSRPDSSRPATGRMTGLRGQLYSRQKPRPLGENPLSSASDPHLPTFLDPATGNPPHRLQTAVLAKGRRTLYLGPSGSDTCLVPSISNDDVMATPTLSCAEPSLSSTHYDSVVPFQPSVERQSVNECLESISKFDHLHLGQISATIQGEMYSLLHFGIHGISTLSVDISDDVLDTFLSEYREKRLQRQQKRHLALSDDTITSLSPTRTDDEDESAPCNQNDYHSDTEDSIDEEDASFTTPVDPKGVELVINLLSTWGDRFYVGLTGIELYTSSGRAARVQKVSDCPEH